MFRNSMGLRIAFIFTGGFMLYEGFQNWLKGQINSHPEVVLLCLISYLLAFTMLFISMLEERIVQKLEILVPISLIFSALFSAYTISEIFYMGVYRTDSMALTHYAAFFWNFNSWNPYAADLQQALVIFSVDVDYLTFTPDGDIITKLNYPALHFLIYYPFIIAGLQDMRWVTFLFEIGTIAYIYVKAPKKLRALMLIPIFAGSDLAINFTAGCLTDFLWVLPMLVVIFEFRNELLSGTFYGLACSMKQIPWILAPFLLIKVWKQKGVADNKVRISRVLKFTITSFTFFIIPNVFFILKDPKAWFAGISQPIENLLVVSQGFSMITQIGIIPLQIEFYSICALTVFTVLLINYYVYFDKLKYTLWIFPAFIMWFSYRGLQNYFIYWIPLFVASLIVMYSEDVKKTKKIEVGRIV